MDRKVDVNISNVMKAVSDALQLDGDHEHQLAYVHYLESVQNIISCLLEDASAFGVHVTGNTQKFVKLGHKCMERILLLLDPLSNVQESQQASDRHVVLHGHPSLRNDDNRSSSTCQDEPPSTPSGLVLNPILNTSATAPAEQLPSLASNVPAIVSSPKGSGGPSRTSRISGFSPVELAQQQNQKLLAAYQARLGRTTAQQTASLKLTLQRRVAENMAIAKAREKTLTRKMQERHQRLQQEAVRHFNSAVAMSKEELERHHVYTQVLAYETSRKDLIAWRQRLEKKQDDTNAITVVVKLILSMSDHPVTQLLKKYQLAVYNKLQPLVEKSASLPTEMRQPHLQASSQSVNLSQKPDSISKGVSQNLKNTSEGTINDEEFGYLCEDSDEELENTTQDKAQPCPDDPEMGLSSKKDSELLTSSDKVCDKITSDEAHLLEQQAFERHLHNIVADVHDYLEKLMTMFLIMYESLRSPSGRDACYAQLEEPFFKSIWNYLIALFRVVKKQDEDMLQQVMIKYDNCEPADLKIANKYQLANELVPTAHAFPYEPAVVQLKHIHRATSPLSKLESLVQVTRLICSCVEDHFVSLGETEIPKLGADDLLPILGFVIIRSGDKHLVSECSALEELIHEGYLMGEEGYCLTSFQTALCYVLTLLTNSPTP